MGPHNDLKRFPLFPVCTVDILVRSAVFERNPGDGFVPILRKHREVICPLYHVLSQEGSTVFEEGDELGCLGLQNYHRGLLLEPLEHTETPQSMGAE